MLLRRALALLILFGALPLLTILYQLHTPAPPRTPTASYSTPTPTPTATVTATATRRR